jgi:hypothetical protein
MKRKPTKLIKSTTHPAPIQFITDEKGKQQYVVLKLNDYNHLIEDYQDLALIASRKNDEYLPLKDVLDSL